jgi:hypothetical protein
MGVLYLESSSYISCIINLTQYIILIHNCHLFDVAVAVVVVVVKIWRETTWGGYAVRQIQAWADRCSPFLLGIANIMNEQHSATAILLRTLIKILVMVICISFVYLIGHLMQKLIGQDNIIIVEEEVEIIEDDDDDDDDGPQHANDTHRKGKVKERRKKKAKAN